MECGKWEEARDAELPSWLLPLKTETVWEEADIELVVAEIQGLPG